MPASSIGDRIRQTCRDRSDVSLKGCQRAADISHTTFYQRLKDNDWRDREIAAISRYLGVPEQYLRYGQGAVWSKADAEMLSEVVRVVCKVMGEIGVSPGREMDRLPGIIALAFGQSRTMERVDEELIESVVRLGLGRPK